jgi:hypothetical protein
MGGAHLYGFTEAHFQKADKAAAAKRRPGEAETLEITIVA